MTKGCVSVLLFLVAGSVSSRLEQSATAPPTFEVTSIKPNRSGDTAVNQRVSPGIVTFINVPVSLLIELAYQMEMARILNLPRWTHDERWDITATFEPAKRPEGTLMAQAMLADRFAMRVHRETRELSVFVLERISLDKLGPNLNVSSSSCDQQGRALTTCTWSRSEPGMLEGHAAMWGFLHANIGITDRPVIDATGLMGRYDLKLEWNATTMTDSTEPQLLTNDKPSIFRALEEQLGLRLRPARRPTEVLVIDSIERPSEN